MLTIENRDFTSHKFLRLCQSISDNYSTVTMAEYFENRHPRRFILMRHDVDRTPEHALVTAKIEHELGIKSTYYFRTKKSILKPDIITQIKNLGHEIGYHYETLSNSNGDFEKAIKLFQSDLNKFRKICEIKTISMHGKPLSKYDNRELWKKYDFRDFGIIGEAYLSARDDLNYFSDTGRTWDFRNKLRDYVSCKTERAFADITDDLIQLIEQKKLSNFYILTHPERWPSNFVGWSFSYSADLSTNLGKKILTRHRGQVH